MATNVNLDSPEVQEAIRLARAFRRHVEKHGIQTGIFDGVSIASETLKQACAFLDAKDGTKEKPSRSLADAIEDVDLSKPPPGPPDPPRPVEKRVA